MARLPELRAAERCGTIAYVVTPVKERAARLGEVAVDVDETREILEKGTAGRSTPRGSRTRSQAVLVALRSARPWGPDPRRPARGMRPLGSRKQLAPALQTSSIGVAPSSRLTFWHAVAILSE
jgi:hypothetical protein